MNNDSQSAGPEEEAVEEEIFVDAITSPAAEQEAPTLRRSTWKRKSVSGCSDLEAHAKTQKFTGKRPRPIPNMHKKDAPQAQAGRTNSTGAPPVKWGITGSPRRGRPSSWALPVHQH